MEIKFKDTQKATPKGKDAKSIMTSVIKGSKQPSGKAEVKFKENKE